MVCHISVHSVHHIVGAVARIGVELDTVDIHPDFALSIAVAAALQRSRSSQLLHEWPSQSAFPTCSPRCSIRRFRDELYLPSRKSKGLERKCVETVMNREHFSARSLLHSPADNVYV